MPFLFWIAVLGFLCGWYSWRRRARRLVAGVKETAVRMAIIVNGDHPDQRIPLAWPGVTAIAVVNAVTGDIEREILIEVEAPHAGPDPRKL